MATDATGDISWKAVQEAFGAVSVQQHQSRISMNLRFPGQYYDQETGTHYNFHRDYKPNAGRYVQSDPIGLRGGVNTFLYSNLNPMVFVDTDGVVAVPAPCIVNPAACATAVITGVLIVYEGCKAVVHTLVETVNSSDSWWESGSDKARENSELHRICDMKNPYPAQTCDWAKWELDTAQRCFYARKAWMDKYNEWNSNHIGQLEQVERRIRRAAERVNKYCCEECEG